MLYVLDVEFVRIYAVLINNKLIDFVEYDINIVDEIPNDPKTGKFRFIVSLKQEFP